MRRLVASAIAMVVCMAGTISPRAGGDNTNNKQDHGRVGRHWDIVDALEYCQKLHELISEEQRKNKTELQLDELREALSEKHIVSLMAVSIHVNQKQAGGFEIRFWRDASRESGREIQVVLKLRRRLTGYEWERVERIYQNRQPPPGIACWLKGPPPSIPKDCPEDYWQRTAEGRWRGMVDLVRTLAEFTDALVAEDRKALHRMSLFGVDSYPGLRRFGSTIAELRSVAIEPVGSLCPDYYSVRLTSATQEFTLGFIATPGGWKYKKFGYRYLGDE